MFNKRFRSTILFLSFSYGCSAVVNEQVENKTEIDSLESSDEKKSFDLSKIIKYSLPFVPVLAGLAAYGIYSYTKESESDKILRQDLENDLECDIINYLDGDKISLTRSEIKKYSSAYSNFLSRLDKDEEVKKEGVYVQLRACALFLIRSHARLSRKHKVLNHDVITDDTERYKNTCGKCPLSKKLQNYQGNDYKYWESKDYLKYIWSSYDQWVIIGPDGPWGWYIKLHQKDMKLYYENCKPI